MRLFLTRLEPVNKSTFLAVFGVRQTYGKSEYVYFVDRNITTVTLREVPLPMRQSRNKVSRFLCGSVDANNHIIVGRDI
jgi:hypothetical protein